MAALKVRAIATILAVIAMVGLGIEFGATGIALAVLIGALFTGLLMALSLRTNLRSVP